jgi:hypothetical protein
MGGCCQFGLGEVIRWVRVSALAGCSPRGLGGMSYPFKGFKSSGLVWERQDVVLGCGYYDASHPGAWKGGEVPWSLHMWGGGWATSVRSVALYNTINASARGAWEPIGSS